MLRNIIMIKKLKNIFSLLLLVVLFAPSIVKLGHHHEKFFCNAKSEKHFHNAHEKCIACNFEFSVFLTEKNNIVPAKNELIDSYKDFFKSSQCNNLSNYSFKLRGPPDFTNSI